jgi:hypothetical protein
MKINFGKLLKNLPGIVGAGLVFYQANKTEVDGAVRAAGRVLGTNKPPKGGTK